MSLVSAPPGSRRRLVVAIDGPASSGKSSVGAAAAERLGYRFFDTGLLYRAITLLAIRRGIADDDVDALVRLVGEVALAPDARGRLSRVLMDGMEAGAALHGPDVDARVSAISSVPAVRAALIGRQRVIAEGGGIVMAGRDIGTVILPDADLKIYLDASVEERARRRAGERALASDDPARRAVLDALRRRDELDEQRPVAPLRPAHDAVVLRTDGNELADTVELVVQTIRAAESAGVEGGAEAGRVEGQGSSGAVADQEPARGSAGGSARAPASPTSRRPDASTRARTARRPLPVSPIATTLTPLIRLGSMVGRFLARTFTRVRIEGDPRAIPSTGPVLVIFNHASNADGLVVGTFLPPRIGRPFNWLGKRELVDLPLVGWLAVHGGIHAVERSAVDLEAFRIAQRILAGGQILAVFPEGTRSRNGELQAVKDGLAMLAQRTGVPIVPIGIADSDRAWPRGRAPRIGRRIVVRIGAPFILPGEVAGSRSRREAKGAATRLMMGALAALLPERQRGAYADAVAGVTVESAARVPVGAVADRG